MAMVQIEIKCKCGKVLQTKNVNPDNKGKTTYSQTCSNCKRKMMFDVIGKKAFVYEQGK